MSSEKESIRSIWAMSKMGINHGEIAYHRQVWGCPTGAHTPLRPPNKLETCASLVTYVDIR